MAILMTAQMALHYGQIHIAGFLAQVGSDVHGMDKFYYLLRTYYLLPTHYLPIAYLIVLA